jgi:hypothetical protein
VVYIFPYVNKSPAVIKEIPIEQIQANVLPEIKSFENSINLNQQIFYEFRKINSENKLIEEILKKVLIQI